MAYDIDTGIAERYRREISGRFGVAVEIAASPEGAVRDMDIVMSSGPITKVRKPAIMADWIAPGCLYISLDRDSYISDEAMRAMDLVFSDDREALFHAREHENAFHAVERVDADLTGIAAGAAVTRSDEAQRVAVFVNGLGIEDLAAAIEIYGLAQEKRAGIVLPPQFG